MSCTRNACGSSIDAYIPVISSEIDASWSPVARSAASAGDADLEDAARLEHLVAREAVQRGEEAERLAAEHRRSATDERAGAVARLDDAHGRQRAQARPDAGTADPDPQGQFALGRQAIARAQFAALDELADVTDDKLGGNPLERFLGGL